ncbi:glycosyltransferase family 2 protein [Nocardioides daphniae]|uniref:glycosyltransferase family 2 protein n=1 Tax=Nocardioides daphniae TaxID=402297 RepID=UPI0019310D62|nr:galactosyltransferase-related protein [Nocardioides daphniae]
MSSVRQEPKVAVVTIAHGRHDHLAHQQRALAVCDGPPPDRVVVAMGDPELHDWRPEAGPAPAVVPIEVPDEGLPLAAARNAGARTALARGADVLVFLDVDCVPAPGLVAAYTAAVVESPYVVWSGPVTYLPPGADVSDPTQLAALDDPHPARPAPAPGERQRGAEPDLFWSLSFALGRSAWERTGGFWSEYVGYGGEDTDFARVVREVGLELGWDGSARAYHQHHPTQSPPVQHLDAILRNGAVFAARWGEWPMRGWLEEFERAGLVCRRGDQWERCATSAG